MDVKLTSVHVLLFCLALVNRGAGGQEQYRLRADITAAGTAAFTSWKAGDDRISEFAMPFAVKYPINDQFQLYMVTAPAFSTLSKGRSYHLEGLSDVKVGGHYFFWGDKLLVTFGINLPAGKSRLDPDEWEVATVISRPPFNFRVPGFGQGLDLQAGFSSAWELAGWYVGGGISYLVKGGFRPYETSKTEYVPGNELSLILGANRGRIYADVIYSLYTADTWGGNIVFQSGATLLMQMSAALDLQQWRLTLLARDKIKMKSSIISAAGTLKTERYNHNGNQFEIEAAARLPSCTGLRLKTLLAFKLYSNNDFGFGAVTLFGPGAEAELDVTSKLIFSVGIRFGVGKYHTGTGMVTLSGFSGFAGLQTVF